MLKRDAAQNRSRAFVRAPHTTPKTRAATNPSESSTATTFNCILSSMTVVSDATNYRPGKDRRWVTRCRLRGLTEHHRKLHRCKDFRWCIAANPMANKTPPSTIDQLYFYPEMEFLLHIGICWIKRSSR